MSTRKKNIAVGHPYWSLTILVGSSFGLNLGSLEIYGSEHRMWLRHLSACFSSPCDGILSFCTRPVGNMASWSPLVDPPNCLKFYPSMKLASPQACSLRIVSTSSLPNIQCPMVNSLPPPNIMHPLVSLQSRKNLIHPPQHCDRSSHKNIKQGKSFDHKF